MARLDDESVCEELLLCKVPERALLYCHLEDTGSFTADSSNSSQSHKKYIILNVRLCKCHESFSLYENLFKKCAHMKTFLCVMSEISSIRKESMTH